jgi:hypothetical protein
VAAESIQQSRATLASSTASAPTTARLYWTCQALGWGVLAISRAWAALLYLPQPWLASLAAVLALHGAGLGTTHALRAYLTRRGWRTLSRGRLAGHILVAGLVLGVPFGVATYFTPLAALQDPGVADTPLAFQAAPGLVLLLNVVNWAFVFFVWLALYFVALAVRQYRSAELRESELARALQMAELRLLKSQLNPHFLFNALNTVRSLIAHDPARAQDAVTRLANTLRYTLSSSQDELVTLAQELEIVQDYLGLESLRLEDRLSVDCEIEAETRGARIPVMLLQTIVENAIKHGIAELPTGGVLKIRGSSGGGVLTLVVENPRPDSPRHDAGEGIGLRNAAERLRLLFGDRASLQVDLSRPTRATVTLRIPLRP